MAETKQKTGHAAKKGAFFRPAAMVLAASLAFTVLIAGLTGCADPSSGPETHVHDWSAWENVGAQYTKYFDTTPPQPATYTAAGKAMKEVRQNERRTCSKDGTTEDRTVTVGSAEEVELPIGQCIASDGLSFSNLPEQTLPQMTNPIKNVSVISLINVHNTNGNTEISGVDVAEADSIIRDVLGGMKTQAENLSAWFVNAKESYPAKAEEFASLQGKEDGIINVISNGVTVANFHSTATDAQKWNIVLQLFGSDVNNYNNFNKYLNAYAKGHYLAARDWQTDPTALAAASSDFQTALTTARDQAVLESLTIRTLYGDWTNPRGTKIVGFGDGVNSGAFQDLMSIMKTKIVDALGLTGVANADKMAEALIIQLGQDNEEFRALIGDFQKANELNKSDLTNWPNDITNALDGSYTIAQVQPQSSTHLAHIDPKTQFQPDAIKTTYGKPYEQLPLDAVKPSAYSSEYTDNFTPRKDERAA
jgi:hypothetical protein